LSSKDSDAGKASEDSWGHIDDDWEDSDPEDSTAKIYTYRNGRYVIKTREQKAMARCFRQFCGIPPTMQSFWFGIYASIPSVP
jgi:hypothetical protein